MTDALYPYKTLKAEIRETERYSEGKNKTAKTGAKYPYRAKSYHSSALPKAPASTVFVTTRGGAVLMIDRLPV